MPLFEVTTKSTFKNVYLIEAASRDDASALVMNGEPPADFYQKHLGEFVESNIQLVDGVTSDSVSEARTSIHNRGYF